MRLAAIVGVAASTIGAVLARAGMPRLAEVDRLTGELLRGRRHSEVRYEREQPGELLHVDVKKLGRVPDGGGWRVHGRREEVRGRGNGFDYVHVAIGDHSRLAYSELLADERKETAAAFWTRADAYYASCGITVRRVLTDNGACYRSFDFRDALAGIAHKRTRPYRPATNGKVERFHRTLLEEWAYARPYASNAEREAAYPAWLHRYNHHRGHTALNGRPPASRVTNLSGQNS